jgi:hypothetical protein
LNVLNAYLSVIVQVSQGAGDTPHRRGGTIGQAVHLHRIP